STKLGWLCDSILKTATIPSPISTTPAFSPGPCTTCVPRVGSRFKCTRDDLYEQCSLHITLKIPSSVNEGSRPSIFCVRAYSSGERPCSAAICGVTFISVSSIFFGHNYIRRQITKNSSPYAGTAAVVTPDARCGALLGAAKLPTSDRKTTNPSADPSEPSTARSGCGINPST